MNVNLYLPDDLGAFAKEHKLPLSRLLRTAVTKEKAMIDASATLTDNATEHLLALDGYTGRITGTQIAHDGDTTVFQTTDGRVIVHDAKRSEHYEIEDPEEDLRGLNADAYLDAMTSLGIEPVIDL